MVITQSKERKRAGGGHRESMCLCVRFTLTDFEFDLCMLLLRFDENNRMRSIGDND